MNIEHCTLYLFVKSFHCICTVHSKGAPILCSLCGMWCRFGAQTCEPGMFPRAVDVAKGGGGGRRSGCGYSREKSTLVVAKVGKKRSGCG